MDSTTSETPATSQEHEPEFASPDSNPNIMAQLRSEIGLLRQELNIVKANTVPRRALFINLQNHIDKHCSVQFGLVY